MPVTTATTQSVRSDKVSNSYRVFGFPDPVNDKAARVVASVVVILSLAFVITGQVWLLVVLAYGFWARVLTGPVLSPLGRFATRVAAPKLGTPTLVPGPPKRLAQGIGTAFTTGALVLWLSGAHIVAIVVLVGLLAAATLEAVFGLCLGCKFYALLVKLSVIRESSCVECADISTTRAAQ
jgi:hypothetical protein